ncbi:ABC-three component system middle component 1 [Chitinophaga rhizosphaerae]|uniref:ABC-three component system middle component 1 n=1 Tax=Chitinophaga rhizosphaerae TaxID=1864947 RepID=UPI000F810773|nr:ABC-three component system middle component 1 [Chitinophaga rhizosphaerae]
MENIITQLFIKFGFVTLETDSRIKFFTNSNSDRSEYYLVLFIKKADLSTIDVNLTEVLTLFESKKALATDVEKNTSLIICVEFENYAEDCVRYKNRLLQLEEDEFFYRKYVIPYTPNALLGLNNQNDIVTSIHQIISDEERFDAFNTQIFANEIYFLAMQLSIKLPFFNLNVARSDDFISISELLSQKISQGEQQFLSSILKAPQLEQNQRDQLLQKVLDPNDTTFDTFINSLIDDAPTL